MNHDKNDFLAAESQETERIEKLNINEKLQKSFLSYAMSVIVSRALPDIRDGLKPVQRRIVYGMNEMGVYHNVAHKKSARIVGDVMGKYHPHGDSSIYDAMVRMAQPFSYRYPLVDGHGNFGNIDGDGAAAMRYTEARMSKIASELVRDIDKNTVDFIDNYDGTEKEPVVLPSRIPNLLVNGATGIAVGMATNIPPHNLGEVVDAIIALIHNSEITIDELMQYIKGPDFPTGGQILGLTGLRNAYTTGNGTILIRSKAEIETNEKNGKNSIIVTEIPYMVNKTKLIERIAEIAKDKIVEGITDIRDESNRKGIRIVIELRKDVNPEVMLNNLYKYTQLQASFGINMICLINNEPRTISLKQALEEYLKFQIEIITRRTEFNLNKALERLHILEGYVIAQDNIDEIIKIIRETTDGSEKEKLIQRFNLTDVQATAILDMQLRRLSGLNREKILNEIDELNKLVVDLKDILARPERKLNLIENELLEIKEKYNDERKSEICLHQDLSIENEDLIPREDVIITITNKGYAKRMKQDSYKVQNRGGVGVSGIKTKEDDDVRDIIPTSTHDFLYFFTNLGRVYAIKAYQIPASSRTAKGLPLVNVLNLGENETIRAVTNIPSSLETGYLLFTTKEGLVKRSDISEFKNIRANGKIAISLKDNDELVSVLLTDGNKEIVIGASNGKAIRFNENDIRVMGRTAAGVKGIRFQEDDYVVGVALVSDDSNEILVITEKGYGKRSDASSYRLQTRGGMGVKALNVTEKNGRLVTLKSVSDDKDLIITTDKGMVIRMHIKDISLLGRASQGVKLIRLKDDHSISTVAIVEENQEESTDLEEQE